MNKLIIVLNTKRVKGMVYVMSRDKLSEIIDQIRDGHPEAFNALYMETNNIVYFHAKSILKNEQDALDATQDTYLVAFQKLNTLKEPKAAKQWLCGIASNICLNKLRKAKHESGISLDDDKIFLEPEAAEETMPEKVLDKDSTGKIVMEMIENLSEVQKLTLLMFYFDEMSIAQIAQAMECSENTVKSRLGYARKNIEVQVLKEEKKGIKLYNVSPAIIALALQFAAEQSMMPLEAVPVIASAVANDCGYSLALSAATAGGAVTSGATAMAGTAVISSIGAKVIAIVITCAVMICGVATGLFIHNRNQPVETAPTMSKEQAAEYYKVLNDIVSKNGICASATEGPGLAYAELIDFDADGNEELYLYYIDRNHGNFDDEYFKSASDNIIWSLHETIWQWDGSKATQIYSDLHFNGDYHAAQNESGRILYADNGIVYLSSIFEDYILGGYSSVNIEMQKLENSSFKDYLFSEAQCHGESGDVGFYSGQHFYSGGQVIRDGVKTDYEATVQEHFSYDEIVGSQELSFLAEDSPAYITHYYINQFRSMGKELIFINDELSMEWVTNDVQGLIDTLSETAKYTEAVAVLENNTISEGNQYSAFRDVIIDIKSSLMQRENYSDSFSRFLLMDCDADGDKELLAIYNAPYPPSINVWGIQMSIFDISDSGKAKEIYSFGVDPVGNDFFSQINFDGKSYVARQTSGGDGGDSSYIEFNLLSLVDGSMLETHKIEKHVQYDGSYSGTATYSIDGAAVSENDYNSIIDSEKILVVLYGDSNDESLSLEEMLDYLTTNDF